ncbi:DNA adenine methylase [Chitinophaga sp. sic0106]|uniref:DNA adenine methylase n=1 Tax=Chitinophaga sp. sic0106 TaxID=2854785 RepID=UPI001C48851E|nr:DNA adenine methylase [Chitinophaga sp. sic0106]MBV7529053.1 DNA adenine methylase [Chitinophaga sp. sic0106]
MSKSRLKTPISYYGGKQKLSSIIVSLIPEHTLYCEPFVGGAAVFFAKPPSEVEVINDTNREMVNFYRVVQRDFVSLEKEIRITLHSRDAHRNASVIYAYPELFSDLKRAWAVWALCTQSFAAKIDSPFGYDKSGNTTTKKVTNKRESFTEDLAIRLQNVQLECSDALYVIHSRDTAGSFFYCDPPYYNSDMGHYDGYSIDDYEALLKTLANIQGKFLLSSYPSDLLKQYTSANGWYTRVFEQGVSINAKSGYLKRKWEVLTANFPI